MLYPYLPAHVTEPKECRKLYLVALPPKSEAGITQSRLGIAEPHGTLQKPSLSRST